jgi:hypothetical protein
VAKNILREASAYALTTAMSLMAYGTLIAAAF